MVHKALFLFFYKCTVYFLICNKKNGDIVNIFLNARAVLVNCSGPVYIECYISLFMSYYAFIPDWLLPSLPMKGY
jgi:hypothetical protein